MALLPQPSSISLDRHLWQRFRADEATSALDIANEDSLYKQLAGSGTTLISIAHRPSVLKYHSQVLELNGNGGWNLYPAKSYRFNH